MIVEGDGLWDGERLRNVGDVSALAHLFFPFWCSLGNNFARLELDWRLFAEHAKNRFGKLAPSIQDIKEQFRLYEENYLILTYESNGKLWGQWDVKIKNLRRHKTVKDNDSPRPPEPRYTEWLKKYHPDNWQEHHSFFDDDSISAKRSVAGAKGAAVTNAKRQKSAKTIFAEFAERQNGLPRLPNLPKNEHPSEDGLPKGKVVDSIGQSRQMAATVGNGQQNVRGIGVGSGNTLEEEEDSSLFTTEPNSKEVDLEGVDLDL